MRRDVGGMIWTGVSAAGVASASTSWTARLDALADQDQVSPGIVIRRCLEAGIGQIERKGDAASRAKMAAARDWWAGLNRKQRDMWQNRLPRRKGRDLIAEAWQQVQGL